MQEKLHKNTFIKERIIQFVENQSIKKVDFFSKIGVTSANFRGNQIGSSLSSTTIEIIITHYPEINLHWLITGKGEMLTKNEEKTNYQQVVEKQQPSVAEPKEIYKDDLIEILKEQVADLKKDKELLRSLLESRTGNAKTG